MKAIAIEPGTTNTRLIDSAEPSLSSPYEVKVRMLEVGICGTDREEALGGRADPPEHSRHLIIGHEMFGQVLEVGSEVSKVKEGDFAVFTVRRGCNECVPCQNGRSDMCRTGRYKERGIKELHGFETEYVVDHEDYIVKVPVSIRSVGVLTEPMSVAAKAIDEALTLQAARLPEAKYEDWLKGKKALVAGVGAIGLLAAFALRLRGAEVVGLDIVDEDSRRPQILQQIGGSYIDGRQIKTTDIDEQYGEFDFIFEATGVASLSFELIDVLGRNGIYVMTGIPGGDRPVCFQGADTMKQMVLKNQIILGSVNASTRHFAMAISDLEKSKNKYGNLIDSLITTRVSYNDFMDALSLRSEEDIKTVIEWGEKEPEKSL
ncbi:glucose 1-dehydrogenase [Nafulsella turpanensis]|uniref:glucose 1-dehydrogenase n=1 Tax=Nafulsella turpanensis TaxID=1265690 RepID=UPI00034DBD69|nr:glucose 1-dehydrogenase [Nafulsella turpanensis]